MMNFEFDIKRPLLLFLFLGLIFSSACKKENLGQEKKIPGDLITDEKIPIVAFHAIPFASSTLENYRIIGEGGYNLSLPIIWSNEDPEKVYNANLLDKALKVAANSDVKIIAGCYELHTEPEATVRRFMNSPGLAGWFLQDEPTEFDFPALSELAKKIKSIDPNHYIYINLWPLPLFPTSVDISTYQKYLDDYIRLIPADFLSFDSYPCMVDDTGDIYVLDKWYFNLQMILDASKKAGLKFWAFAASTKYETQQAAPTLATMRLQMFTNLAYGAQGLQYFVYNHDPNSQVSRNVRQLNKEIQGLAGVFLDAEVISVTQTGETIPFRTNRFMNAPDVIKTFETGKAGAVVSVLKKGNRNFFVVVSRDVKNTLPVTIRVDQSVRQVTKEGKLIEVNGLVTQNIPAGDILVYTWE